MTDKDSRIVIDHVDRHPPSAAILQSSNGALLSDVCSVYIHHNLLDSAGNAEDLEEVDPAQEYGKCRAIQIECVDLSSTTTMRALARFCSNHPLPNIQPRVTLLAVGTTVGVV